MNKPETNTENKTNTESPKKWRVVLHNDDYTTQDFVVFVLTKFFRKPIDEAISIMLKIHTSGKAVVGIYSKDMAETKACDTNDFARHQQFPLLATIEPE
jgi:ATP-dependent Clp protease adaptor protein ClpS